MKQQEPWDTSDFNAFALRRLYAANIFISQALQNIDARVDNTGEENFRAMESAGNLLSGVLENLIHEKKIEGAEKVFIGGRVSYTLPDDGYGFFPRFRRVEHPTEEAV